MIKTLLNFLNSIEITKSYEIQKSHLNKIQKKKDTHGTR